MKKRMLRKIRKAQISIFVILAVLIIIVIGIYFSIRLELLNFGGLNPEVKPVYTFVEKCIKETSEDAVYHIGDNGGYFISPNNSLDNHIPVYFDKGEVNVPSVEDIEKELELYMDDMLFFCVKNFVDFPDFNVRQGEIKSEVKIEKGKVLFDIKYPLSISKGESSYVFSDFEYGVDVRLFLIQNVSSNLIKYQKEFPEDLCLSCIEELAIDNEVYIIMRDFEKGVIIFEIVDAESEIKNQEYVFYFANKYEVK